MTMQEIQCGVCATRYQVKAELGGTLVDCPRCHAKMLVPRKAKATSGDSAAGTQKIISEMLPVISTPPATRAPAATSTNKAKPAQLAKEDADDAIGFRDDDDDQPATRSNHRNEPEDELLDIASEPIAPTPSPADRGSMAGQSRAGQSRTGQSAASQTNSGDTRAGQSRAGESRAGESRAGQSRVGRSGSTAGSSPRENRIDSVQFDPDSRADADGFGQLLDINASARSEDEVEPFSFKIPALPSVMTRLIMPWALILICLGGAGFNAVSLVLNLPGRPVGLSMVGLAFVLYALVVVTLTLKAIYSAAITAKLRLPDAVWFQAFSLAAMPTAGLVIGYCAGGLGPMITLGLLGLLLMVVPMALMFRAEVTQALLTAFYAAAAYVVSTALSAAILIGLGFGLNRSALVVPWKPAPVIVAAAKVDEAPEVVIVPDASPATNSAGGSASASSTTKPVEAPIVAAPALAPAGPHWRMPVEPVAVAIAWPASQPAVHESIEVMTPLATAHATANGPFVALLQPKTTAIYDLRTGKRTGLLKSGFGAHNLILSADGRLLAGVETAASQNSTLFAPDSAANSLEIWSTADNRLVGQIPTGQSVVPLGFAAEDAGTDAGSAASAKLITYGSSNGMSGLQVWDAATQTLTHQWNTPKVSQSSVAISNSGKYVAIAASPVVRLLNVQSGEIAGEMRSPVDLTQMKGVAFSTDGKMLAAIVPQATSTANPDSGATAILLEWNIADGGKLLRNVPIDLMAAAAPIDPEASATAATDASDVAYLQWTPDGHTLRVGSGLFEATTGKAVYVFPSQMLGNLSGKLVNVSDKRAFYEFQPAGTGNHLVIKTLDLPGAMINSAVVALSGNTVTQGAVPGAASIMPATAIASGVAPVTGSAGVNAMLLSPAAAAPGAPDATMELALQGEWDVTIKSMIAADAVLIQKQLAAQSQAISKTQSALDAAGMRFDQVSHYRETTEADGEIVRHYDYDDDVRSSAEALVDNLQERVREGKATVTKLQRAAEAAPQTRILLCVLDNGVGATVTTDTDTAAALADKMHTGDRVHIIGFGQVHEGVLQVKLRGAGPATAPIH